MNEPLTLIEDSYRALASSSPWRWRTLHFTNSAWNAEAWVRRPGQMVVRFRGELEDHSEPGGPPFRYIGDTQPTLRPDGLVLGRAPRWPEQDADDGALLEQDADDGALLEQDADDGALLEQDDPMFQSYTWVAMLDPIELASGTVIADLAESELRGRRTWWATVSEADGYEPRCLLRTIVG